MKKQRGVKNLEVWLWIMIASFAIAGLFVAAYFGAAWWFKSLGM